MEQPAALLEPNLDVTSSAFRDSKRLHESGKNQGTVKLKDYLNSTAAGPDDKQYREREAWQVGLQVGSSHMTQSSTGCGGQTSCW